MRFGPTKGLFIATVAMAVSWVLGQRHGEIGLHVVAILLMGCACLSAAAGCVVGFGNHDNGCLPVRRQIVSGLIGLVDLLLAFATIISFASLLSF